VQGKLRNTYLNVRVETECAHYSAPMEIEIDSNLHYKTNNKGCEPVIFVPAIDLFGLKDDSIIDAF
jgi:hypothetical protein